MNSPSHAILNLALLGHLSPEANLAIVVGAVLPDLPIFGFYVWAKRIEGLPEREIWREAYYRPQIQNLVAIFHSIPLALMAWFLASQGGWEVAQMVCLSCVLHSLGDLPVHNDDAHRHFFPFSNYRLISPISYWDPKHYGSVVAAIEFLLVSIATVWGFPRVQFWLGKGLMVAVNLFYFWVYYRFYLSRRCREREI